MAIVSVVFDQRVPVMDFCTVVEKQTAENTGTTFVRWTEVEAENAEKTIML